jgi:hypothetical protein
MSWQVRIKPTAADLEHLTEDGNQPSVLMLGNKGIPQFNPLAKKPRAFVKMALSTYRVGGKTSSTVPVLAPTLRIRHPT